MTVTASAFDPQENDLYETDRWATLAALKHVNIAGLHVWEPAAGNHKLADVLRICSGAASVTTSDIVTYNRRHNFCCDYTIENIIGSLQCRERWGAIFTNPPFGNGNHLAAKFCRLSLQRCAGWVAMLCTAKFDFGSTRVDLFRDNPRYHCKISLIDRIRWFDTAPDARDGTEDHAWYVWRPIGYPANKPFIVYEGNPFK